MATYTSLFSSGLLAPRIAQCTTPALPPSPMAVSTSPTDPVGHHPDPTATPIDPWAGKTLASNTGNAPERPKMRRRRSSINIGANPMALIKSPVRNAGAALQRTGFMSPTRNRAASITANDAACENNSLLGRLRSGSVSGAGTTAANPPPLPKRLPRRAIRLPVPLAPPPSAPLPAPPSPSPTAKYGRSLLPPAILVPLARRRSCMDSSGDLFSPTLPSATMLSPDYVSKTTFNLSPRLSGPCDETTDEVMQDD